MGNTEHTKIQVSSENNRSLSNQAQNVKIRQMSRNRCRKANSFDLVRSKNYKLFKSSEILKHSFETAEDQPLPNVDQRNLVPEQLQFSFSRGTIECDRFSFGNVEALQPIVETKRVFLFDWDDTLCCFKYLNLENLRSHQLSLKDNRFKKIDENSFQILNNALKTGSVYIVTNGTVSQLKESAANLMPETHNLLFNRSEQISQRVQIVSAKIKYETPKRQYEKTSIRKWKYKAFKNILEQCVKEARDREISDGVLSDFQLVAIGDSVQEIEAAKEMQEEFSECFNSFTLKTIKMKEYPTLNDLVDQQKLFLTQMDNILKVKKKMTIRLERPSK